MVKNAGVGKVLFLILGGVRNTPSSLIYANSIYKGENYPCVVLHTRLGEENLCALQHTPDQKEEIYHVLWENKGWIDYKTYLFKLLESKTNYLVLIICLLLKQSKHKNFSGQLGQKEVWIKELHGFFSVFQICNSPVTEVASSFFFLRRNFMIWSRTDVGSWPKRAVVTDSRNSVIVIFLLLLARYKI